MPYSKAFVKDAPRVEDDEELTAQEEQRLFEYYALSRGAGAGATAGASAHGAVGDDTSGSATDDAMTRSEERLQVGTERVEAGRARLRKRVVTDTETRTVSVWHEEVRVERHPVTDGELGRALDGPAFDQEEYEIVLTAQRPVVTKEAVPVERVRLDTDTVTEQVQVSEQVRKEQIDLEGVSTPAGRESPPS